MSIFSKKNNKVTDNGMPACSVQTAGASCHPFASISSYTPLSQYNNRIYRSIREGVPIIDSAINKIVRLMGGFEISCGDDNTDKAMKSFFSKINVGGNQQGIYAFVDNFMSQLLTYGSAIGEMVTDENGGLYALYNGDLDSVSVKRADNGIDLVFCSGGLSGGEPFKHQQRILFSVLNPEGDSIYGTSLLRGLPFVADILLKIYNTIGTNWQRLGNLRYAVTYKPNGDMSDARLAKERAQEIGRAWQEAMSCTDAVKDFVAVGDVSVKVIGADNNVLSSEIPVRQLLEQIVAKTGIPPYMLGLSWSTTERMSVQQADMFTTELRAYRRILTPVLLKIANKYAQINGIYSPIKVSWNEILLQDETEHARARLYNAQADSILKEVSD